MKRVKIIILTNARKSTLFSHDFSFAISMAQKNPVFTKITTYYKYKILEYKSDVLPRVTGVHSADSQDRWYN